HPCNIQELARGTDEMIARMMVDLGVEDAVIEKWTLEHFRTSYMQEPGDEETDGWKQFWYRSTEIVVTLDQAVSLSVREVDCVGTYAHDASWRIKDERLFPAQCVVTADFYEDGMLETAQKQITLLARRLGREVSFSRWKAFPRKLRVRLGEFS